MRVRPPLVTVLVTALLLLVAGAAQAYIIILKDGSRILARSKYQVVETRAIITLQNGTQTFVAAAQIDVARTDEANRNNYGNALVLRENAREAPAAPAPPTARKSLADLIEKGATAPREREAVRREEPGRQLPAGKTAAGFVDFAGRSRKPYPNIEAASALQQLYRGHGVEEVQIFEGTQRDRPFVEITTASEASVFRALTASAAALTQLRAQQGNRVAALEILMTTPTRERAGQFVLTPEAAAELTGQRVEAFFVSNVQF